MKKIYIIGIVLSLVFSITGCGIRETKNADKQESTVSTETKRQEPLRIEKTHKDGNLHTGTIFTISDKISSNG